MVIGWLLFLSANARASGFFIATNGLDSNPGTVEKPFATLERARDLVRTARATSQPQIGPITIDIRGGDYLRTNALELNAGDSGSPRAPIIWRAYQQEHVRFLGGRPLSGFVPVSDAAIMARLDPAARTNVLQIDLRKADISKFAEMQSRGFARASTPSHCELFFGGKPMTLARWPNEGEWEHIAGFVSAHA